MNLRMFLITTGETVIGDILSEEDLSYTVKAICVQPQPSETGQLSVTPMPVGGLFGMFAVNGTFVLQKSHIVAMCKEVNKQAESIFIQATTGLTIAQN